MSDSFFDTDQDPVARVYFRIEEPGALALRSIEEDLADFGSISSLAGLLGGIPYEIWSRPAPQVQPKIVRLRYGSPFEVVAQLSDAAQQVGPGLIIPGIGVGAVALGRVLKSARALWRDFASGYKELGEGARAFGEAHRARAEGLKAAAEAEEIRGRTLRERFELQERRRNNPQWEEEIEVSAALPEILLEVSRELADESGEQLDAFARQARHDQDVMADNAGNPRGRPSSRGLKEREIISALARLILKENADFGRDEEPR